MTNTFLHACQKLWVPLSLLCLFSVAILFRPLLPIDETRYMSAAWEMHLRGDWLAPLTVNFQPYHHKPPLLLWLINLSWSIFGVSRWAGTIPVVVMAGFSVVLTQVLSRQLFPARLQNQTIPFLMMGSLPFLAYSTLVMFDITLSVFVLTTLVLLIAYAKDGNKWLILLMALAMGLGVLTKGPVAWLYIIFPMVLGPLWNDNAQKK